MPTDLLVRSWTDPIFRSELSEELREELASHPAGDLAAPADFDLLETQEIFAWSFTDYTGDQCCSEGGSTDTTACASYYSSHPCCL